MTAEFGDSTSGGMDGFIALHSGWMMEEFMVILFCAWLRCDCDTHMLYASHRIRKWIIHQIQMSHAHRWCISFAFWWRSIFFFMFPGIYANSLLFHCTNDERDTRATFQLKLESPTTTHIRTWKYIYMLCRKMMHSTAAVQLYHQHAIKYGLIFIDCCRSLFFCFSSTRACLTVYIGKHFDYTYKLLFGVNSSH